MITVHRERSQPHVERSSEACLRTLWSEWPARGNFLSRVMRSLEEFIDARIHQYLLRLDVKVEVKEKPSDSR
jgi:hypothetical protein